MKKLLLAALPLAMSTGVCMATPVVFTTNDGPYPATFGPYRVQFVSVYVDGSLKCYTESHGNCTGASEVLTAGLHEVKYVWANCNNPNLCPHYGEVTHYVLVPDQVPTFYVRIPTVRARWATENTVGVSLNGVFRAWALSAGLATTNIMSGCYTASYYKPFPGPAPDWPAVLPGTPDSSLKGFDRICVGAADTYPVPATSTDPHVTFTVPDYWP
jgi:hypothetical protein